MPTKIKNTGSGPGPRTLDGCSVEFWKQLKAGTEPELIASVVPVGGYILELGAGVGRITHPLIKRGYAVTAIDNSPEMLAETAGAETHVSDIEDLALNRYFHAVVLGSHLIRAPEFETRRALLATCRRHLAVNGVACVQWHGGNWPGDDIRPGLSQTADEITDHVDSIRRDGSVVHMTL